MVEAGGQSSLERLTAIELDRGLYAVRYAGPLSTDAPAASLHAGEGSEHLVQMMTAPGAGGQLIWPGSAMVLAVQARSTVNIVVRATAGTFEARFEVDQLDKNALQPSQAPSATEAVQGFGSHVNRPASAQRSLSLVGHVARRGDVTVSNDQWLAGPQDPAQIEGFTLSDAPIDYQVLIAGQDRWSAWCSAGQYAGTKGRYLPLVGLRFRLRTEIASADGVRASALFLGASPIEKNGRDIEFQSRVGVDPLIGLRIAYTASAAAPSAEAPPPPTTAAKSRVRVIRSS